MVNTLKKSDLSNRKYLTIFKDIQGETGAILMEGKRKTPSTGRFKEFNEVMEVEIDNKNGNIMKTSWPG